MRDANLPSWAKVVGPGAVDIYADELYPEILEALKQPEGVVDPVAGELGYYDGVLTAYWLDVALQCAKLDIQYGVAGTTAAPPAGGALRIFVQDGSKAEGMWRQSNYPIGVSARVLAQGEQSGENDPATRGKEAREHYKRMRNLPL